jgi:hypothetical protein
MKKIITSLTTIIPLTFSLLVLISLQSFAQNDSSRTSPSIKLVRDSSFGGNDTITIGNMIIVKKQGYQDNRIENNTWYNKKRKITHGTNTNTNINITNGKITKDNFFSANGDSVQIGSLLIVTNKEAKKPDFKTIIKVGDASYGRPIEGGDYEWIKGDFKKTKIEIAKAPKKLKNVTTNWFSFDLGFANYRDESAQMAYLMMYPGLSYNKYWVNSSSLKLDNRKSSNFNIWIVQQKLNVYQHKINLKYGVGFEMFNFRFEQPVSFRNEPNKTVFMDDVNFTKNKLFVKYLTVPVQLNFQPNPYNRKGFYASIGLSAGYLVDARNKQISAERGKQKYDGNFELNNFRFATIGELGIGGIRLYGSFGSINLFDKNQSNFSLFPYAIGLRFSNF